MPIKSKPSLLHQEEGASGKAGDYRSSIDTSTFSLFKETITWEVARAKSSGS
jgi:hypothetical protein